MNREQMVEKAALALGCLDYGRFRCEHTVDAERVVDALLPQVADVEELKALPLGTSLLRTDETGAGLYDWATDGRNSPPKLWRGEYPIAESALADYLPLTVVWQP